MKEPTADLLRVHVGASDRMDNALPPFSLKVVLHPRIIEGCWEQFEHGNYRGRKMGWGTDD